MKSKKSHQSTTFHQEQKTDYRYIDDRQHYDDAHNMMHFAISFTKNVWISLFFLVTMFLDKLHYLNDLRNLIYILKQGKIKNLFLSTIWEQIRRIEEIPELKIA